MSDIVARLRDISEGPSNYLEKLGNEAADLIEHLRQRIAELESTIRSHGIPVKSFSGGEAHYCTKSPFVDNRYAGNGTFEIGQYVGSHLTCEISHAETLRQLETFEGVVMLKPGATVEEPTCNPHPDAPHGFCRDASHSADRYVCECEGWEPSEYDDLNKEITRLSKIEDLALDVVTADTWNGDEFYDCLCRLKDALGEG
jgi:hypothetical protein